MNNTTGADATALSIAALISEERARNWELCSWGKEKGGDFRIHCLLNACFFRQIHSNKREVRRLTEYIVLENIFFYRAVLEEKECPTAR